jgi:hypothetical protein
MPRDPKYGSAQAQASEALAKTAAQIGELDKSFKTLTATEGLNTKSIQANTTARLESVAAMQKQVAEISSLTARLQAETSALAANTAAWRERAGVAGLAGAEGAGAAAAAGGARRVEYGASSAGFGTLDVGAASAAAAAKLEQAIERASTRAAAAPVILDRGAIEAREAARRAAEVERFNRAPILIPQYSESSKLAREAGTYGPGAAAREQAVSEFYRQQRLLPQYTASTLAQPEYAGLLPGGTERVTRFQRYDKAGNPLGPEVVPAGTLSGAEADTRAKIASLNAEIAAQGDVQQRVNGIFQRSVGIYGESANALTRHGALSTEFISALARGEVTMREFGNSMVQTIGKFAGWAVAGGLVYGAYEALKKFGQGAIETQSGVSQLERSLEGVNKAAAASGFRKLATEINVPISEAASAQFYAARAFPTQQASKEVARTALLAQKLDEVPIQDAVKTFAALNVSFKEGPSGIAKTFNELDVGQLKFNARLQQTLPAIGRAASSFAAAGGTATELNEQIIQLYRTTGGGGGTGGGNPATALIREPANLRRPEAESTLREFGFRPADVLTHVGRFNREVQELAPNLSNQQLQALAKAAGGGSALGLRYFLPLYRAGQTALPEEVKEQLAKSEGSAARDLEKKLGQVNEQIKKIGIEFEAVGSQIGEGGFITAIKAIASTITFAGRQIGAALGPFERIGSIFSSLPSGATTPVLALGGLAAFSRFARTGPALTARAFFADSPYAGLLGAQSARQTLIERELNREYLNRIRQRQAGLAETVARRAEGVELSDEALKEHERKYGPSANIEERFGLTPKAREVAADRADLEKNRQASIEAYDKAEKEALRNKGRYERLKEGGGPLIFTEGGAQEATAAEARFTNAVAEGNEKLILVQRQGMAKVAASADVGLASAGLASRAAARVNSIYGATLLSQFGSPLSSEGLIATQVGELRSKLSARFQGYGGKLLGAFNTAFFGAIAANVIGEAFGGSFGKKLEGASSQIGLGAAAGGLAFGLPGAFVGGAAAYLAAKAKPTNLDYRYGGVLGGITNIGLGILEAPGISQVAGLFGFDAGKERERVEKGISQDEANARIIASDELRARTFAKLEAHGRLPTIRPGAPGAAAEERRLNAAVSAETVRAEYEAEAGETGRGSEGSKLLQERIKRLDAAAKLYGGTRAGRNALNEIAQYLGGSIERSTLEPQKLEEYASRLQTGLSDIGTVSQERFKQRLAAATNNRERRSAFNTLRSELSEYYESGVEAPLQTAKEGLAQQEAAKAKVKQEIAHAASSDKRARLQGDLAQIEQNAERFKKEIEGIGQAAGHIQTVFQEAARASARATIEAEFEEGKLTTGRKVAELAGSPAAQRAEENKQLRREEKTALKELHSKSPYSEEHAAALKQLESARTSKQENEVKAEREQVELVQARGKLAEAQVGANNPVELAAVRAREAARVSAAVQASRRYSPIEKLQFQASAAEASRAYSEVAHSQEEQTVQLRGQIEQARLPGNAVAQAQAAKRTAEALLAIARNPVEQAQAQLLLVESENQLREAFKQRIRTQTELAASFTNIPLRRIGIELRGAERELKFAKGPEEKEKAQAQINNLRIKQAEEERQEAQNETKFLLGTGRITNVQAVEREQKILRESRRYKLTPQQRRDIEQNIYGYEEDANRSFAVGAVTQAPTLYDALTLTRRRPRSAPGLTQFSPSSVPHPVLHQHNSIRVNVTGSEPGRFAAEMERVFGSLTAAQLRNAGLTR